MYTFEKINGIETGKKLKKSRKIKTFIDQAENISEQKLYFIRIQLEIAQHQVVTLQITTTHEFVVRYVEWVVL